MHADQLRSCLDSAEQARRLFDQWRLRDVEVGQHNLRHVAGAVGLDRLAELHQPLGRILPRCPDPDMALNGFERFVQTPAGASRFPILLENRARVLEIFLQLCSTSQFFCDLLSAHPDYLDMLRVPLRSSPSRVEMRQHLQAEVDAAFEDSAVLRAFRQFRQKQILRIGTNDIIRDRPLEEITRDISRVADTALEVSLATALRHISKRFGEPFTGAGQPTRCVVLAFGKLGGKELNYSSDIDLMFLYDGDGGTRGQRITSITNDDFFGRVLTEVVRLLSAHTDMGQAYRVDLRLRPEGDRGPLARSLSSTLAYYDTLGRTWERQALIKVRPAAGDMRLGDRFLKAIEPFVYRKYLSFAEINEIKALKRRIEQRTRQAGGGETDVKTGHGGIRDIEFTIQFLQLLNGGELPDVRERNTLKAMQALARAGCLSDQEFRTLDDSYRFLRKTEHRLQLMFDLQTHTLPDRPEELRKLALRMGYHEVADAPGKLAFPPCAVDAVSPPTLFPESLNEPLNAFLHHYRSKTDLNRKILDHLLHQTFQGEPAQAEPEADLILDPDPDPRKIETVLGRYPFRDPQAAYQILMQLATETVPFLSTRRCRQFLASIAPRLLAALAETPDPDMALINLEKVSASIGGKGVLWELFSFNQPSLKLYVELCAWSQFLSEILINNPGMVDELLDSLLLNQPRSAAELGQEMAELCRGAADLDPILHSFQDKELLRIGVRDILGKETVRETTAALTDLAETILVRIASVQYAPLAQRYGVPYLESGPPASTKESRFALLGLGKLGGREMGYQSDLDLILIYEGDGRTGPPSGASRFDQFKLTDNFHFFTELARNIIKASSAIGPMGRLYQVDMRLRPTGRSGSLVIPLNEFERYYQEGGAQLWERQALTRARVVYGETDFASRVAAAVEAAAYAVEWKPAVADEILDMRLRLEQSGGGRDLKRGAGGIIDIEFLCQMYRLKYGRTLPALRDPNTWATLDALLPAGLLSKTEHEALHSCYDFLRLVESRLRIVHNRSLNELPQKEEDLDKLGRRLGCEQTLGASAGHRFLDMLDQRTRQTRELFRLLLERERSNREKS